MSTLRLGGGFAAMPVGRLVSLQLPALEILGVIPPKGKENDIDNGMAGN